MTIRIDEIDALDWQPKLGSIGSVVEEIRDICQAIQIILTTPKGSDPHRPEFGSDIYLFIDEPVTESVPKIISQALEDILRWEPRAEVKSITNRFDETGSHGYLTILIEEKLSGRKETTEVNYG